MSAAPARVDLVGEEVAVAWSDGHESFYKADALRAACPCALCKVKRESGRAAPSPFKLFEAAPKIQGVEEVGRYALQFRWTDRHDSGIYDYRMLRGLCACPECAAAPNRENTMPIDQIRPKDAQARLKSGDGSLYLDVRSEAEFAAGHSPGAINIPLMHMDPATRQMSPNADFLRVVQANLRADQQLVVGCASGGRSQKACDMMAGAGYSGLANIRGGFLGMRDPAGRVLEPGWTQEGLPVTQDLPEGTAYSTLKNR